MSPPDGSAPDGTSSAVPADLRAYSRAAVQIDDQIHQLALRLGRLLDTYRASRPEFGRPIPRLEDDLERYARRCLEIDQNVGRIADAFEHAGSVPAGGGVSVNPGQPVVAADAAITAALDEARRAAAAAAPPPPPTKEHHDHALLGGLIHAVEHPGETLSHAASAVEHAASDAWGSLEHAGEQRVHDLGAAGAALVHGIEHPSETLDAAASGLEKAAGEVAALGGHVVSGAGTAGGEVLHAIEHPAETLASAETLAEGAAKDLAAGAEHVTGDVVGGLEKAGGAVLDAAEHPADTAEALSSGAEHVAGAALHGLESLGGGLLHAIENPLDTLSSAEQAVEDFVTGFAAGVEDMAQAAMLLARVIPGTPMWMASMAIDPVGTAKLQEQFAKGLAHMVENPVDTLGNMIDIKDLQDGNVAKWLGHLTPDVIVTVLTMGGGGAAAAAGEGAAKTAAEATAEQAAKAVAEDAAKAAAEDAAKSATEQAAKDATETAARDASAAAADDAAASSSAAPWEEQLASAPRPEGAPPIEPVGEPLPAPPGRPPELPRIDEGLPGTPLTAAERAYVDEAVARAKEILAASGKETPTPEALAAAREMVGGLKAPAEAALRDLRQIAQSHGGDMVANSERYMVKGEESLARKLTTHMVKRGLTLDEAEGQIADAMRYTMLFGEREYGPGVAAAIDELRAQGYRIAHDAIENSWIQGEAYKGININASTPGGQIFELQFHTTESLAAKGAGHALYKAQRLLTTSEADVEMMKRAGRLSSESLDHPPAIGHIGIPKVRG